jgi:3-oxoacyl-[acyl-carrier protein] reductase
MTAKPDRRVALVSGGSRGIGAAIARSLAAAGLTVVVNYVRDGAAAQRVVRELGGDASAWQADVTDRAAVDAMIAEVLERYGRLDTLVINGAAWRGGRIDALAPEAWQTVIDTSLTGAYHLLRAATPALRKNTGRIVVISSVIGIVGFPGDAAYASAKAGLFGLVRSVAKELGRDGVTVNAVAPGFIETDMTREVSTPAREHMLRRTVLRRFGEVDDVAAAVRFLVCDAGYVTGHTLVVDGGLSL